MTTETTLPALAAGSEVDHEFRGGLPDSMKMSPALAIFFNEKVYQKCAQIAGVMSKAEGVTPRHLIGKAEACFAVISRAIVWRMDPWAVALSTYQTPNGAIGYEGKLVQGILENSGQIEGRVRYELFGDWSRVRGKFKWTTSAKGHKIPEPGWDVTKDEEGLGVKVIAKVIGELDDRTEDFLLTTFWPRNSTLWALRPEQQIKYAAARAFANTACPGILLGVPFDVDPIDFYGEPMTDITPPRPKRSEFERPTKTDKPAETSTGPQSPTEGRTEAKAGAAAGAQTDDDQQAADAAAQDTDQKPPGQSEAAGEETTGSQAPTSADGSSPKEFDREWYEAQLGNLSRTVRVSDIADLRSAVDEALPDDPAIRKEWEKACDTRTRQILSATGGAKTAVKKK